MGNYKFGFDIWGLVLFAVIMLPNAVWFFVPAPNDVLRLQSVTEGTDIIASVLQTIFVAAMCFIINKKRDKLTLSPYVFASVCCVVIYFITWILYYNSIVNPAVILSLCISPCLAFLFFAFDRKNVIAVIPISGFMVCHIIYGAVNFII